jgi:hypothetical protein
MVARSSARVMQRIVVLALASDALHGFFGNLE